MQSSPSSAKSKLLVVSYEGGSGFPSSEGPSKLASYTPRRLFEPVTTALAGRFSARFLEPHSREELIRSIEAAWAPGTTVLSTDHSVTYPIVKALRKRGGALDAVIVIDQHKDIYDYKTHGPLLSKANPFRILLDEGLLKVVIFVGSRLREEAFLHPFVHGLNLEDRCYALLRYVQKMHHGLEDTVFSVPVTETRSLAEGVRRAIELVKKLGYRTYGLDIDLDAFDSLAAPGVDYGPNLPDRITATFERKRAAARGIARLPLLWRWHSRDRIVRNYIKHKIEDSGLDLPTGQELASIASLLKRAAPAYVHVTEFKPEFDTRDGATTRLVTQLFGTLASNLHH